MLDHLARFCRWLHAGYIQWEDNVWGSRAHAMLTDEDIRRLPEAENVDGVWVTR